jgi:hypothetical protein
VRWLLKRREGRPVKPFQPIDPRRAELQAAKEILAEIFRVRAAEVNVMIQMKLAEERTQPESAMWPAMFCVEGGAAERSFESMRKVT